MYALFTVATLSWGVLAFGAVYPWASVPLIVACGALGAAGLVRQPPARLRLNRCLAIGLGVLGAAIGVQLLPIPRPVLGAISPGTDALLRQMDRSYALSIGSAATQWDVWHELSTDPAATAFALAMYAGLALGLLGWSRGLSVRDLGKVLPGLILIGAAVAVGTLVYRGAPNGKIYGWWQPLHSELSGVHAGGPFVNRNHLAGWILQVLPLALGYLAGLVERAFLEPRQGWRNRLVWTSSREFAQMTLVATAAVLMAAALVQTMSRSGMGGLLIATLVAGAAIARSHLSRPRRAFLIAFVLALLFVAFGRVGPAQLEARLHDVRNSYAGRVAAWRDTVRIISDVPVPGAGLGSYAAVMRLYQGSARESARFTEAHNDYLQLLAEGGLLVALPASLCLLILAGGVRRRFIHHPRDTVSYWIRVGAVTGLLAVACQETVEFSLQMPGNAVLFVFLAAIAAGELPHDECQGVERVRTPSRQARLAAPGSLGIASRAGVCVASRAQVRSEDA